MLANPAVQKKGQAEVDAVTGGDRLPTYEDRESLPYVQAIVQEVLRYVGRLLFLFGLMDCLPSYRWHPAIALGTSSCHGCTVTIPLTMTFSGVPHFTTGN